MIFTGSLMHTECPRVKEHVQGEITGRPINIITTYLLTGWPVKGTHTISDWLNGLLNEMRSSQMHPETVT